MEDDGTFSVCWFSPYLAQANYLNCSIVLLLFFYRDESKNCFIFTNFDILTIIFKIFFPKNGFCFANVSFFDDPIYSCKYSVLLHAYPKQAAAL